MKIAIEACLRASFRSGLFHGTSSSRMNSRSVNELYELLLQAFKTNNAGNRSDLPDMWRNRRPLVCLYPEGEVRLYLLKPERPLANYKTVDTIPLTVLIVNNSDSPSPRRCIESSLRTLDKANGRFGKVKIDLPNEFRLFPISDDEIDDSEHHFIASTNAQTSPLQESKTALLVIFIFALVCQVLENSLSTAIGKGLAQVIAFLKDALFGAFITKAIDSFVISNKSKYKAYLDLDQVLKKEEEHLMIQANRTAKCVSAYDEITPLLQRSDNK